MQNILVTGGCGYIGSHTLVCLVQAGYFPIVFDNLSNSSQRTLERVEQLTGIKPGFMLGDITDFKSVDYILKHVDFAAVIHFAGLKAVGESVSDPLSYYHNNVYGSLQLIAAMKKNDVKTLIFSSSATVYGLPTSLPLKEDMPLSEPTNPYGMTKRVVERILSDLYESDPSWSIMLLRYFNPVGAHHSALIGEDPRGIPNNLMPFIAQTAIGTREKVMVYGDDYPTPDGTGIRDYIHVMDLAEGHVKALEYCLDNTRLELVNLGTGKGYSVIEVLTAFANASGMDIPFEIVERRAGDIASCYADPSHAKQLLNWQAQYGIEQMCQDAWQWQLLNPAGYDD